MSAAHLDSGALSLALAHLREAPRLQGTVEMIVRRPEDGAREILDEGVLDPEVGLVGDNWLTRGSRHTPDGAAHPLMQLNVTSARMSALLAATPEHRALVGDQFHLDLDLSPEHLPAGSRLALGTAVIEVTARPHTGCVKFRDRYGHDAMRFVNSQVGKELRLRGLCARVVQGGTVRAGDVVTVIAAET
jgi:hypothetical protein